MLREIASRSDRASLGLAVLLLSSCGGLAQIGGLAKTETPGRDAVAPYSGDACTSACLEKACGLVDGCGGTLDCGSCPSDQVCANNVCVGSSSRDAGAPWDGGIDGGAVCTPTTCAAQAKNCGDIDDDCGGSVSCGPCAGDQVCTNNLCDGASSSDAGIPSDEGIDGGDLCTPACSGAHPLCCGGSCVADKTTDMANCGACGNACGQLQICRGRCVDPEWANWPALAKDNRQLRHRRGYRDGQCYRPDLAEISNGRHLYLGGGKNPLRGAQPRRPSRLAAAHAH